VGRLDAFNLPDGGDVTFRRVDADAWVTDYPSGWVLALAAALTTIADRFRTDDEPVMLTDSSSVTYGHAELVAVVAESTETLMTGVRSDQVTTEQLAECGASSANLSIMAGAAAELDEVGSERHVELVSARDFFSRYTDRLMRALDPRVRPLGDGTFEMCWNPRDIAMLDALAKDVDGLLESDDASIVRLFPPAYGMDHERSAGYDALVRHELIERRRETLGVLREALELEIVTGEQLESLMRAMNDLRLVLGTELDVSEDDIKVATNHSEPAKWHAYLRLGMLLGQIVEALDGCLEEPDDED